MEEEEEEEMEEEMEEEGVRLVWWMVWSPLDWSGCVTCCFPRLCSGRRRAATVAVVVVVVVTSRGDSACDRLWFLWTDTLASTSR